MTVVNEGVGDKTETTTIHFDAENSVAASQFSLTKDQIGDYNADNKRSIEKSRSVRFLALCDIKKANVICGVNSVLLKLNHLNCIGMTSKILLTRTLVVI